MHKMTKLPIDEYRFSLVLVVAACLLMSACSDSSTSGKLGSSPPDASFTVTPVSDAENTYLLESTTEGAFMWQWNLGNGNGWQKGNEIDTAFYSQAGNYKIKLRAFGEAGSDTASNTINVAQNACIGNLKTLTGCGGKTWVLKPAAGALWIGPPDFSATWWSNTEADVASRSCQFNDEVTFNLDGTLSRDLKGDIWVDEEGGTNPFPSDIIANNDGSMTAGCYDWSMINSKYSAWGSGSFDFSVSGSQLKISGEGAYLALYKAGDSAITDNPVSEITYQIQELTQDKLVIAKIYDWGAWQFTFVPKE